MLLPLAPLSSSRIRFHRPDRSLGWDESCGQRRSHQRLGWAEGGGGGGGEWLEGAWPTSHLVSASRSLSWLPVRVCVCVCVTEPLCFLLMNSLVSLLKRTVRPRASIRSLMVLLTNIRAGVSRRRHTLGFPLCLHPFLFFFICSASCSHGMRTQRAGVFISTLLNELNWSLC